MKSEKGVTLMSLAIYIVLMLIVLAILATVRSNFQSGVQDVNKQGAEFSEISKFNMYFLQEVKKQGNNIDSISGTEIAFTSGNVYSYSNKKIYLQNEENTTSIEIANDISNCDFEQKMENGKKIIIVTIQTKNTDEIVNEYVLNSEDIYFNYEDEESYINN